MPESDEEQRQIKKKKPRRAKTEVSVCVVCVANTVHCVCVVSLQSPSSFNSAEERPAAETATGRKKQQLSVAINDSSRSKKSSHWK